MAQTDMTTGNIRKHLIHYAIPLVLGNLFQLTYNMVDSVIAGRFIGREALAAEGIASPVMNIVILGMSGICMGAGVLMSEFFGAKNYQSLKKEMSTVAVFGLFFSMVIALLGIVITKPLLRAVNVPDNLMEFAAIYLRIIFLGAPFTYFYNALASALKSIGDSKTPLKFLMVSSLLNGLLDIIFIGFLGFGIVCSAVTTVIAEAVSALLSVLYIYRNVPILRLGVKEFVVDRRLLGKTLRYGAVTALQQSCQPIGKLLIQGAVNALGVDVIAAYNAVTRIDDFAFTPEQSISHAVTTFTAQNRGAVEADGQKGKGLTRLKQGFAVGLRLEFLYWIVICGVTLLFRRPIMQIFVTGEGAEKIVAIGCQYLGNMAFFYLFPAFTNGIQGFFRGMGKLKTTLLCTFIQTSLRVIFTILLTPHFGIYGITFACVAGWSAMLLYEGPYYFIYMKKIEK